jgi:SAM-dependent methyltransferase
MSETNNRTLESYNGHIQEYIDGTPQEVPGDVQRWIDASLQGLPLDAKIIEVGTAFGRDASYIENQGYKVERTDATEGFVDWLNQNGHTASVFNLISDDFDDSYDLVFADAVLLHFTREEVEAVLTKIHGALRDGGRFAFSLKQGDGEGWSEEKLGAPRYFCYWTQEQIEQLLPKTGYSSFEVSDGGSGHNNAKWLHIIAGV